VFVKAVAQEAAAGRDASNGGFKAWAVTSPTWASSLVSPLGEAGREAGRQRREGLRESAALSIEHRVLERQPSVDVKASSRYTTELLALACGPRLLELGLYPDAKELTESFAAFAAVREHLKDSFPMHGEAAAGVTVVCVGDGVTPRTAALFAFRTKWRCIAIDPLMRVEGESTGWHGVERLEVRRDRIQETVKVKAPKILLVCVHAHVSLEACLAAVEWTAALGVVVMPCCNFYGKLRLLEEPQVSYEDPGVVSPHRLVRVYSRAP